MMKYSLNKYKNCQYCGVSFSGKQLKSKTRKFCSVECKHKSQIGKDPWNKNLTKETDHRLKSISEKMSGKNNPMYGKTPRPFTPEEIEKIRKSKIGKNNPMWKPKIKKYCVVCGSEFEVIPSQQKRKCCSRECAYTLQSIRMKENNPMKNPEIVKKVIHTARARGHYEDGGSLGKLWSEDYGRMYDSIIVRMTEDNPMFDPEISSHVANLNSLRFQDKTQHPMWKGGKSFEPYSSEFDDKLKLLIRTRDCFTCQECGIEEKDLPINLNVHHIDYDKQNCDELNLISLCISCNSRANANREYWEQHFNEILRPHSDSNEKREK